MPPEASTAQPSASVVGSKSHLGQKRAPLIAIIILAILSLLFLAGSVLYQQIFFSSWAVYILVFVPPCASLGVYLLSKAPLEKEDKELTALEQSNTILSTQNTLYYAILQSILEGMIIIDPKGIINFCNKKAADILQTDTSALVGQPFSNFFNSDQLNTHTLSDFQLQLNTLLGKRITLKFNSFPLISNAQNQGTIFIITDVSGESELEKLKLDFVAQAAHQLRTPLTILKSYLSVLADSISAKLTPDEKVNLDRSVVGANQLALLIENLLNVSKIEDGKLDLHPVVSSIEQIVGQAINKNINNANQKGIKVYFLQSNGPMPQLIVDPSLIEQAVSNLLANAIENSRKDSDVTVSIGLQNNAVVVSVIDRGIGIPSEASNKLFNKFYKVSGNLVQASKGIGLGLYNTRAIIEAHGGTISVNSLLGKGSTFFFSLPIRHNG